MGYTQATVRGAKIESLVANEEVGFKVLTFLTYYKKSEIDRQPIGKSGKEIQGVERN